MEDSNQTLSEIVELIHKIYYLREKSIDTVKKAEYEEKLTQLFELKKELETEVSQIRVVARFSKKRKTHTEKSDRRRKTGFNRALHTLTLETVAN
ncbi:hypothetical protein SAMN05518848_11366 [Paenibacillus sp. PDC88]|nr:hypothetical protein SAMN05518848_11366 [Paenibacillus sp. PDC88]SFS89917.1 hypothetical protein SAMN04488601_106186 [Paenibacillus sp. 453mf]